MVLIIGDIISEFIENSEQFYELELGGSAVNIASYLEEEHIPFTIVSSVSMDRQGDIQMSVLSDMGWIKDENILRSPLLSSVCIDRDLRLIGTASAALDTDSLYEILSRNDCSRIMVSASLLSVDPSSKAVSRALSRLPKTKVFADLNVDPTYIFSLEKVKESLDEISRTHELYIMGEMVRIESAKVIEQSHLAEYLR